MSSSSYIRSNDYNVDNFQPYKLPYQAAMQEMSIKRSYWEQGVYALQKAENQLHGLDPQFTQNKEYLKKFMETANKQLDKIAKSDLSVQDNAMQASKVFEPLYDTSNEFNANLLMDSQTNQFYKQQAALADKYRTTTDKNGKTQWSQSNEIYMRDGYNKYTNDAKSGDLSKIQKNWQNKKAFVPYYDYTQEYQDIMKLCKEDKATNSELVGDQMYIQSTSNNGLTQSKVSSCLGMLSPQAKTQIGIDSYARYLGNKQGLYDDYKNLYYGQNRQAASSLLSQIAAVTAKGDLEQAKALEESYKFYDKAATQGETELNNMLKADPNWFDNNYENIASQVGLAHHNAGLSKALSWQDVSKKLTVNSAKIAMLTMQHQANMQNQRINAEMTQLQYRTQAEMQMIGMRGDEERATQKYKAMLEGGTDADGNPIGGMNNVTPTMFDQDTPEQPTARQFQQEEIDKWDAVNMSMRTLRKVFQNKINELPQELRDKFNIINNNNPGLADLVNFYNTYEKTKGPKDPILDKAVQAFEQARVAWQDVKHRNQAVEANTLKKLNLDNKTTQVSFRGIPLTEKDLFDLRDGRTVKGIKVSQPDGFGFNTIYLNGKEITRTDWSNFTFDHDRAGLSSAVQNKINKKYTRYKEDLDKEYQGVALTRDDYYTTGDITKKQIQDRDLQIKNNLSQQNSPYTFTPVVRRPDGSALIRVSKSVKDEENGGKMLSPVDDATIQGFTSGVQGATTKTIKGETFLHLPSIYPRLNTTNPQMYNTLVQWSSLYDHKDVTSDMEDKEVSYNGKLFRVKQHNINGMLNYELFMKTNGVWKKSTYGTRPNEKGFVDLDTVINTITMPNG